MIAELLVLARVSPTGEVDPVVAVMVLLFLLLAFLFLPFLIIWVQQFFDLMSSGDGKFPGRYDKVLWFVVLILGNILGAIAYWYWKTYLAKGKKPQEVAQEPGQPPQKAEEQETV